MTTNTVSSNLLQNWVNDVQHRVYSLQQKFLGTCTTEAKVHGLLVLGRVLQTAALVTLIGSLGFAFVVGPPILVVAIPALALGILGTYIAEQPQELNDSLQMIRPFVIGQPVGLRNQKNDCWLNSSLQLIANSPALHPRMRQIPELSRFLDAYTDASLGYQKVAGQIDTHALRQFLSQQTGGQISNGEGQEDAAQLFEYLFEGDHAPYRFDQQINQGAPTLRREPMIAVNLGPNPAPGVQRPDFQQLFNHYFNYQTHIGQNVRLTLPRAPDDLLVQAKRFYQGVDANGAITYEKINDPIAITERLTLPRESVRGGEVHNYVCDAFSIHNGVSPLGGHYTGYLKRGGVWWYCSDTTIYEATAAEALAAMTRGYIFHFTKV